MTSDPPQEGPKQLVEHFFRHESANLHAVLTRAFGFARLGLVEDKVQEAMMDAVHVWGRKGIPQNPAGWIHRVARNKILDTLRREKTHQRAVALSGQTLQTSHEATEQLVEEWLQEERLPDSLLRMMFVCCHPELDRRSQVAMTLKILCGFSTREIASGLLSRPEAIKKRLQRAKRKLAELEVRLELPTDNELEGRLSAVHDVLYLLFNEGYSTSHGHDPLREDLCEEAARLCHLLCEHEDFSTPTTRALLSLMLLHAARLEARVDDDGAAVLLEDQDRSKWDQGLIGIAKMWLARSAGETPSRFHLEAAIALHHCIAESVAETRWDLIVQLYDRLLQLQPSPLYELNRAIARGQLGDREEAISELVALRQAPELRDYYLLDCAVARLHEERGEPKEAMRNYLRALERNVPAHVQTHVEIQLARLSETHPEELPKPN